ncbi:YciI family protein [Mucilaginibacter sp.]|uniref:YciI family protein n=1 Tax=Mucilaginibacter sp. TaxID=1882438 RepID=UPI0026181C72|nr:YciI family protein [Mucilaginibacter sp.]MDB4925085.1 transcription initiation protein [Mucilaginibacter sp.]
MNDFLLIFRREASFDTQLTPEQLQEISKPWQDWMGGLAAQNKLVNQGNRLNSDGKVVKPNNVVTNGAYVEVKELIGGYTIIKATSLDEAAEIAKGCPILAVGGSVEVRQIISM